MNTRRILLILAGLIIVAIAGYAAWSFTRTPERSEQPTVYRNGSFNYAIAYPATYDLLELNTINIGIGHRTSAGFTAEVEVTGIETAEGQTASSFEQFVVSQMSALCGVDSAALAKTCRGVESQEPYVASTGNQGLKFYLIEDTKNLATGQVTTGRKGPFYAFDITRVNPGSQMTAVVVRPPTNTPADGINEDFIESIASTVMLTERGAE